MASTLSLKVCDFKDLEGETIKKISWGSPGKKKHSSYAVWTIETESGKTFVVSTHMFRDELNLSKPREEGVKNV
jgi:hypothetical protein